MIPVDFVDFLRRVEDTGFVDVAFGHGNVAVGFDDVEGALFDEVNHGLVKGCLHGREVVHLLIAEVSVHGVEELRCHAVVVSFRGVGSVTFGELPNEHRGQVFLASSQQHVSCSGDARLEVVRYRGVVTGAQRLEAVVPPRDERRFFRVGHFHVLICQPLVRCVPSGVVERRSEATEVAVLIVVFVVEKRETKGIEPQDVWDNVVDALVDLVFLGGCPRDCGVQTVGCLLAEDHDHDEENSRKLRCAPYGLAST